MSNPVSLIGDSAAYNIGDVVCLRDDIVGVYSTDLVFKPLSVLTQDAAPVSKYSTAASGYTWAYEVEDSGSYRTENRSTKTEYQLLSFASGITQGKVSVSQWVSAPTG